MAGFRKDQEYFVPRSKLSFPDWTNLKDILQRLFPNINRWRAEYSSALGDDSKAAANFLNELLPYLAMVIFQDGTYWIHKYPDHEVSILLRQVMPARYERWAVDARREAANMNDMHVECHITEFNAATQQAFMTMNDQMKANKKIQEQILTRLTDLSASVALLSPTNNTNIAPPVNLIQAVNPRPSVNNVLRSTPMVPGFPAYFPNSMATLLTQHEMYKLSDFEHANKSGWRNSLRVAYSRRPYLYQKISETASRHRLTGQQEETLKAAADIMDAARNKRSMGAYLTYLKNGYPNVKARKKV